MYLLHVTYTVKEDRMEDWIRTLRDLRVAEETRKEPGNLGYEYFLPLEGGSRMLLTEAWEDRAAQQAHLKSPHITALAAVKADYVEGTEIRAWRAEEAG